MIICSWLQLTNINKNTMNKSNQKDRKSLSFLIGQSGDQSSIKKDINLPIISQKHSSANTHHFESLNSVATNAKNSKIFKNNRWKANQLYIDDYTPKSNRRLTTQSQKIDENIEKQKMKIFFTGLSNSDSSEDFKSLRRNRSSQEIKEYIQKAEDFIKVVKKNKSKLIKLKINGPKLSKQQSYFKQKQSKKKIIYNYLSRDFIHQKQHEITNNLVDRYIANSSAENLQSIESKGREFLLTKIQNDYKNYAKVDEYKKRYIRSLILSQIQSKKAEFQKQYQSRHHSPYFSFLSLSKEEKNRVIQRKQRKSLA